MISRPNPSPIGVAQIVFGAIGTSLFGVAVLALLGTMFFIQVSYVALPLALCGAFLAGSIFLLKRGVGKRSLIKRVSKYSAVFGSSTALPVEHLAAATGLVPSRIRKDMTLLSKARLSFILYYDKETDTVIKGEQGYREFMAAKQRAASIEKEELERAKRMANPETASLEIFKSEGYAGLSKIRAANVKLPGEQISARLDKLERTVMNIVNYVDAHPEKLGETRKLMNYHLPTTLRLVEKYCEYESLEIVPPNVAHAKANIESTLDTVNHAFENLYRDLFSEDTLDVSTDIDVLNQMLEQEGLTGIKFDIPFAEKAKEPELVLVKNEKGEKK